MKREREKGIEREREGERERGRERERERERRMWSNVQRKIIARSEMRKTKVTTERLCELIVRQLQLMKRCFSPRTYMSFITK